MSSEYGTPAIDLIPDGESESPELDAIRELLNQADRSLDYRPEFRNAIASAHAAYVSLGGEPMA